MSRPVPKSKPARPDAPEPPSSRRGVRMGLAIVLLVAALCILAYRVKQGLQVTAAPKLLQLGEDVTLETPPPPSSGDLSDMQTRVRQLETLRADYVAHRDDLAVALTFARAAIQTGDLLSCRAALQNLIQNQPGSSVLVYDLLGRCQVELADYQNAIRNYDRLIARDPNAIQGYIGKSRALAGVKRTEEAGKELVKASEKLTAADLVGHLALSGEFDQLRDEVNALAQAQAARAANPTDAAAATLTGAILFKLGRYDEARALLEARVAGDPKDVGSRKIMAQILASPKFPRHDLALAEHYFLQVLQLVPGDPDTCWRLAQICADEGRYKQAAYLYSVMLEKAPDSAAGRKQYAEALRKLGRPSEAEQQEKWSRALLERDATLDNLNHDRDRNPTDPEIHARIARVRLAADQYHDALVEMQTAYALAPSGAKYAGELQSLNRKLGLSLPSAATTRS